MRKQIIFVAGVVMTATGDLPAQPLITSLQGNGLLTWTDPAYRSNSVYHIEWAPRLGEAWRQDWTGLQFLEMDAASQSASVPMFYRIVRQANSAGIVGSWGSGRESLTRFQTLTFYPSGLYIQWATDLSTKPVKEGVEIGNYTYDVANHTLAVTSTRDDNGTLGLTDSKGQTRHHDVLVLGDTLAFASPAGGRITMSRVQDVQNPIVGGWGTGLNRDRSGFFTITFYSSGYYVHWQTPDPTPDTKEGVEYGTYTYDPETRSLTSVALRDDNGTMGLCGDPESSIGGGLYRATLTVTNNLLLEPGAPRVQP